MSNSNQTKFSFALEAIRSNTGVVTPVNAPWISEPAGVSGAGKLSQGASALIDVDVSATTFNAVAGRRYSVDTNANVVAITLPDFASAGANDYIEFVDAGGNLTVNNLTILPDAGVGQLTVVNEDGTATAQASYVADYDGDRVIAFKGSAEWVITTSPFGLSSTYSLTVKEQTAPVTSAVNEVHFLAAGAGDVTLPILTGVSGGDLIVVSNDSGGALNIVPDPADTLNNTFNSGAPFSLANGSRVRLVKQSGTNWLCQYDILNSGTHYDIDMSDGSIVAGNTYDFVFPPNAASLNQDIEIFDSAEVFAGATAGAGGAATVGLTITGFDDGLGNPTSQDTVQYSADNGTTSTVIDDPKGKYRFRGTSTVSILSNNTIVQGLLIGQYTTIPILNESLAQTQSTEISNTITADRQATGVFRSDLSAGGDINVPLNWGAFDDFMEATLQGTWNRVDSTSYISGSNITWSNRSVFE